MGYATNLSLLRDDSAIAVTATGQLLDRQTKQPTDKWIGLQMQPADALALAASILVLAKAEGWPIRPDFLDLVERIRLSDPTKKH